VRSSLEVRRPGVGVEDPARFPSDELSAEHTGLSHQRLRPGQRQAFAHRHHRAEEVLVVGPRWRGDAEVVPDWWT